VTLDASVTPMRFPHARLSYHVIGAAFEVHRNLRPGLLESAYVRCLAKELRLRGIPHQHELPIEIIYKGELIDACYRLDFLVDDVLIVEVKAVERLTRLHEAQLLTYLRATDLHVGLLMNFNVLSMRDGIRRIVR
jgi:GxxExxY protein